MSTRTSGSPRTLDNHEITITDENATFPWLSCVQQKIDDIVRASEAPVVVVLEGGHFDPTRGADEFACYSLRAALDATVQLIRRHRRVRIVLGILVDDLNLSCDALECSVATQANGVPHEEALPKELEHILASCHLVKRERVLVLTERNAKNRGISAIKRLLRGEPATQDNVIRHEQNGERGTIFLDTDDGGSVVIAQYQAHRWTARCPLIMGQHYSDVITNVKKRFPAEHTIVVVDFSEHYDRNKVKRGSELAMRLLAEKDLGKRCIINVFLSGPVDTVCIIDEHSPDDST